MKDLISIVVPVYNVEKYLKKCVDSIIGQSYSNLEIILVDDGSTDSSGLICDELLKLDNRIVVLHKKNGGLSSARNEGIKIATGKYIGFVDSDDFIDKNMYSVLYKNIKSSKSDISCCCYVEFLENEKINFEQEDNELIILNKPDYFSYLLDDNFLDNHAWNKLYLKKLFESINYPVGKKFEDIGTTFKLLNIANKVVITKYKGYFYLKRSNSIVNTITNGLVVDYRQMTSEMLSFCRKNNNVNSFKLDLTDLKYKFQFQIFCIKGQLNDLYYSNDLTDDYIYIKKIVKKYGLLKVLSCFGLIKKLLFMILLLNRKIFYLVGGVYYVLSYKKNSKNIKKNS